MRCPGAHRFVETHPIRPLQGHFQIQQDRFAGNLSLCPESKSSDSPVWGGDKSNPLSDKHLQRPGDCPELHAAQLQLKGCWEGCLPCLWPRPLLSATSTCSASPIHTWLTRHLSLEAGALGTDLHKRKHCPSGDRLSSKTFSNPEKQKQVDIDTAPSRPPTPQTFGCITAVLLWTGWLCPQNQTPLPPCREGCTGGSRAVAAGRWLESSVHW